MSYTPATDRTVFRVRVGISDLVLLPVSEQLHKNVSATELSERLCTHRNKIVPIWHTTLSRSLLLDTFITYPFAA